MTPGESEPTVEKSSSAPTRICPSCGTNLTGLSARGLCPRCLLTLGLSTRGESGPPNSLEENDGSRFGQYRTIRLLGEGGMGMVYLAQQEEPIRRQVAVKVIKLGMDTREVMARFNAERQALAMMNHPGIAQVFEAGLTSEGRPYFSMEYVEGLPLTEYCDERRLTVPQRLELFLQVCQAVQHAHQKGVMHRDLKPSNVLVTESEGAPRPKIIDFGLAAALDTGLSLSGAVTRLGSLIGTPEYMSPEQAAGKPVDTRSDIYSLGLMFYELLIGTLPLDLEALREAPPDELLRAIRKDKLPTPRRRLASSRLDAETISQCRQLSVGDLRALLRGELQWIAAKALEKDPARRYASVSEFAADVSNYLTGEPVNAGPASALYRLRKFASRHRVGVGAVLMVAASITITAIVASTLLVRAQLARSVAVHNQYLAALSAAALNINAGDPDEARRHLLECDPDLRGWEWRHLMYRTDPSLGVWKAGGSFPEDFYPSSFGVRGDRLVWHTRKTVEEWSMDGAAHVSREVEGEVLVVNESGTRAACRGAGGQLEVYALDPFGGIAELQVPSRMVSAAFDKEARRIATGTQDGRVQVWDVTRGRLLVQIKAHEGPVSSVLWFPDDRRISTTGPDRHVHIWSAATGGLLKTVDETASEEWRLAVTPTSKWLSFPSRVSVLPGQDVRVRVDWVNRESADRSYPSQGNVGAIAFNAAVGRGNEYGFVNHSGEIQFCDEASGCWVVKRHTRDRLNSLVFVGDGAVAFSGSASGEVVAWDANTRGGTTLPGPGSPTAISLDPSGTKLIAAMADNSLGIWSAFNGSVVSQWGEPEKSRISATVFSPSGAYAASATVSGTVRVWDQNGHLLQTLQGNNSAVTAVQFSPNSSLLAAAAEDGTVRLWNVPEGTDAGVLQHRAKVNALTFHPGGASLATGSEDRESPVQLWDLSAKELMRSWTLEGEAAASILVAHDGEALLAGSDSSGKIAVWGLPVGKRLATMTGHSAAVRTMTLLPDGSRLVSGSDDRTLRVWDATAWKEMLALRGHAYPIRYVAAASGGSRLISVCRRVHLWNTRESARWPNRTLGAF